MVEMIEKDVILWIRKWFAIPKEKVLVLDLLRLMTKALLGKWIWCVEEDPAVIWKQILVAEYSAFRDGWDLQSPNSCH